MRLAAIAGLLALAACEARAPAPEGGAPPPPPQSAPPFAPAAAPDASPETAPAAGERAPSPDPITPKERVGD
jgi:hypothetical protein